MDNTTAFRFDGGATWLNLLATKGQSFGTRPVERLPTPVEAQQWLVLAGMSSTRHIDAIGLERLIELREALRDLAMAAVSEHDPSPRALAVVNAAAESSTTPQFAVMLRNEDVAASAAMGVLAIQALLTLNGPDRQFLKECAEVDCRWVFLDTSGRRHWCPAPACASRGRVRALRARQRETS